MATSAPGMTVLPQYQGDYYTLQNKQALAQALMQQALQPQQIQATGSGPYTVMPKYSVGAGIAQLGQALLAAKMQQQASQGLSSLGQAQGDYLMGTPTTTQPPQTTGGTAASTGLGGAGATPDSLANALSSQSQNGFSAPTTQRSGGLLSAGGPLNPNGMDPRAALQMYLDPDGKKELYKAAAAAYAPTAATLAARQGGFDSQAANRAQFSKDSLIAPVSGTGIFRDPRTGQVMWANPDIPAGSSPLFDASGNVAAVRPIQGAQGVMQGNAAATAAGGAQFKPVQVYNPQTQQMEYSNEAAVTNPASAIPQIESRGNPNAVSPKGAVGAWQVMPNTKSDPGFGVRPASNDSPAELNRVGQEYYGAMQKRYGDPAIAAVAYNMGPGATDKWISSGGDFAKLPQETQLYLGRWTAANAVNGMRANSQGGAPAAAPPLGAQTNIEEQIKGQVDTMQKSYQNLQTVRSGAPAALQDVDNMSKLAQGANPLTIGPAGAKFAGLFSANAAEYEKSRDNLVTNLGSQLGINSDAARDLVYGSIPSYGAPKQAVQNGLQTLRGQIQTRLLKSDYLSDAYAAGDAKSYNQRENQFDQHVTPAIANVVAMPPGPDRATALKQAAQNPQMRARLEWAAQNGVLK